MKRDWKIALFATVTVLLTPPTQAESKTPGPAFEIKRTVLSLNELTGPQKKVVLDADGRSYQVATKPVDPQSFALCLSDILKVDPRSVVRALSQRYRLSDIVFAGLISEQGGRDFSKTLAQKSPDQWIKELKRAHVPLDEAQDRLDSAFTELAFIALDRFN